MKAKSDGSKNVSLIRSLDKLRGSVERLPSEYDLFFHPGKHLLFTFLKGIVYGLGLLAAVAIVIPVIVSMLRGIQWVPLIGDFISEIATRVEDARGP